MDEIRRIIDASDEYYGGLRLAEDAIHRNLKKTLQKRAVDGGFVERVPAWNETEPDVLVYKSATRTLYVADAKDASHESSAKSETARRVKSYLIQIDKLLTSGSIDDCHFEIATNDVQAAHGWCKFLNAGACFFGWVDQQGQPYSFSVLQIDNGYIVT